MIEQNVYCKGKFVDFRYDAKTLILGYESDKQLK